MFFVAVAFDSLSDDDNDDGPSDNRDPPVSAPSVGTFNTTIASLPVDVVVFVHVHPSQVLFNCQPLSRVECLLHIPSLDLVFSSVRDSPPNPSASAFSFPERGIFYFKVAFVFFPNKILHRVEGFQPKDL